MNYNESAILSHFKIGGFVSLSKSAVLSHSKIGGFVSLSKSAVLSHSKIGGFVSHPYLCSFRLLLMVPCWITVACYGFPKIRREVMKIICKHAFLPTLHVTKEGTASAPQRLTEIAALACKKLQHATRKTSLTTWHTEKTTFVSQNLWHKGISVYLAHFPTFSRPNVLYDIQCKTLGISRDDSRVLCWTKKKERTPVLTWTQLLMLLRKWKSKRKNFSMNSRKPTCNPSSNKKPF